jgi:iron complex outermembrane receptor protein
MRKAITFTLLIFISSITFAQTVPINIQFLDSNKKPIIGASVRLINRVDTTKILYNLTDTSGIVKFTPKLGQYIVKTSSIGYKIFEKGISVSAKNSTFEFVMQEDANALASVTVIAQKPLVSQEDDKTIIDPEPIASSSTSAYEIMEKIPGLFLDQDGNIYISSTSPATIYINGREQKMSASDIATVLKTLPPNSIQKIEILRTPSAKFDASSSGGIVNVVLKKGVKIGRTGSVNAGMNQGKLGNQFVGLNLTNNDGDRNSYFNINYTNRNSYDQIETNRKVSAENILAQKSYSTTPAQIFYSGYGLSVDLNKKWNLSIDGRGTYNGNKSNSENENLIKGLYNSNIFSNNLNIVQNNSKGLSLNQGLSTKYKIDTVGSELTSDFSYNYFSNATNQDFKTQFVVPTQEDLGGNGDIQTQRQSFVGQIDLKYVTFQKITLETGIKSSNLFFDNTTKYFSKIGGQQSIDVSRTATFDYQEMINAGYVQASKSFNKILLKLGTRIENTNMYGHQRIPKDTTFKINRTDFFPYIYVSRKISKIAGFDLTGYLIYRRSITRPVYDYLNPSPKYIDQYLYEAGNPTLKPQFTQNYEANISVDNRPIFAFGRNYTQDIFTNVVYQNPSNPSIAYRTYDNLGKNQETYFRLLGAIPPGKKYFFVVGTQYNRNKYDGFYQNKPLIFDRASWTFFTYHQLKINKNSSLTMNGFFRLKGQLQFYELSNFGSLNFSLNRSFLDKKLLLTLSANDVFFTNNNQFTINQGTISANGFRKSDTRRLGFNIRYNFGIKKKDSQNNMMNFENLENGAK